MVRVIRSEELHQREEGRALEMQIDLEVRQLLEDVEDGLLVYLEIVLLQLEGRLDEGLYHLPVFDGLGELEAVNE